MLCRLPVFLCLLLCSAFAADTFKVATYNIENYLEAAAPGRELKPDASRAKVHETVLAIMPDVLAIQEIGSTNALAALQGALRSGGLNLRHTAYVDGPDPYLNLAVLSRFPIVAQRPHRDESYLLRGRRFRAARGFAEMDIRVNDDYEFTLITAHLKSRRISPEADESEMREQEALLLRGKISAVFQRSPTANLIVLGDFNDIRSSKPIRALLGRGNTALVDLRPSERNGDIRTVGRDALQDRASVWTHHFVRDDTFSRVDYILVSRGMLEEWQPAGTYIPVIPNWGLASDHRPVVATFRASESDPGSRK